MGCPNEKSFVGFDNIPTTVTNTALNHITVKCRMNGTAAKDSAFMWVNYAGTTAPLSSTALVKCTWGSTGFDMIRIANDQSYSISYDKLRIANTFSGVSLSIGVSPEAKLKAFEAYPNPVTGILYLSVFADKYIVCNIDGKVVMGGKGNRVDMTGLQSGLYFVKITFDGKVITKKIIKN